MHEDFNSSERNKKVAPDYFRQSITKKIHGGLDPGNTKKYLSQMSWFEQIVFELITSPYLVKYGYELEYPFLNTFLFAPIRSFLYFFARRFNNWRYNQRDRRMHQNID